MVISAAALKEIVPTLPEAKAAELAPYLESAMTAAEATTPKQQAAFVAQLAHESGGFKYAEEIASGAAYENRKDLGNIFPGDGKLFKGRGPIQLTGRENYRKAGEALGLDLISNPQLVATPEVGFKTSAWFWKEKGLNALAEKGDFKRVTKKINGGLNGYEQRLEYYQRALKVLGVPASAPARPLSQPQPAPSPPSVFANGRGIAHQQSGGMSMIFPDVCLTPMGPAVPPIPYPNIGFARDTSKGPKTVKLDGAMCMVKDAEYSKTSGDEAGVKGGVVSGVNRASAKFTSYSFDVKFEGRNACRLGDMLLQNKGNGAG